MRASVILNSSLFHCLARFDVHVISALSLANFQISEASPLASVDFSYALSEEQIAKPLVDTYKPRLISSAFSGIAGNNQVLLSCYCLACLGRSDFPLHQTKTLLITQISRCVVHS